MPKRGYGSAVVPPLGNSYIIALCKRVCNHFERSMNAAFCQNTMLGPDLLAACLKKALNAVPFKYFSVSGA